MRLRGLPDADDRAFRRYSHDEAPVIHQAYRHDPQTRRRFRREFWFGLGFMALFCSLILWLLVSMYLAAN